MLFLMMTDRWTYAYMRGWKQNKEVDFDFEDAHDLDKMTSRAQNENCVKSQLRERMKKSTAAVVLVGEKTKNLCRFSDGNWNWRTTSACRSSS